MKAMVFAAGLGTRLRPLTDSRPKALVEVGGRTMLAIVLERLRCFGIREVIVNAHHFAGQIAAYLSAHNFGMRIEISIERDLLDTGGGLKNAAWFFLDGDGAGQPFLVHNVDVVSAIDLGSLARCHADSGALATLAVQDRQTSRYLLFDEENLLCGRRAALDGADELVRPVRNLRPLGFCGIHLISPRIFAAMPEQGAFSIIDAYLHLAAAGHKIAAFPAGGAYWRDLGRPENVAQAARDLAGGIYSA